MPRILISAASLRLPGLTESASPSEIFDRLQAGVPATSGLQAQLSDGLKLELHQDPVPESTPHRPQPRDARAMCPDVVSACVTLGKLLETAGLSRADLAQTPIHVAKGVCNSGAGTAIESFTQAYFEAEKAGVLSERNRQLFSKTDPLIALTILSNSLQSYLSQILGPSGESTTFGNTSVGGLHALTEAANLIQSGEAELAIVGATQATDYLSSATYLGFQKDRTHYRESSCSAFLILRSEENVKRTGAPILCELADWREIPSVPPNWEEPLNRPYERILSSLSHSKSESELLASAFFFSGGISQLDYSSEQAQLSSQSPHLLSWYPSYGTLGAAGAVAHWVAGALALSQKRFTQIHSVDRDPYGRESWVQLRRYDP